MAADNKKEWMLGLPGHTTVVTLDDVVLLVKGGQIRPTDLVKRLGQPWRAANEVPELAQYFADPSKPAPPAPLRVASSPPPVTEKPKTTRHVPKAEPVKPTSRRIARENAPLSRRPPSTTRRAASAPPPSETRSSATDPAAPSVEAKAPAAETKASGADTKPAEETKAPASETKPPAAETKPPAAPPKKTRAIPKPKPRAIPRLEPMVGKYYSPVDLLRSASFSFDPKKLFFAAVMLVPLMTVAWLVFHFSQQSAGTAVGTILLLFAAVWVVLGLAFVLVALAYVSRRQLEGSEFSIADVISYTGSNVLTAVVFPIVVMIPSLLAVAFLWLLGLVRNTGGTAATILKIAYIVPMLLSFVGVIGVLVYQLACMYVPAAAAIEGLGLTGAVNYAWNFVRRQWGRVVLHWLIVTVAFGVIAAVCLGLAWLAMGLPEILWWAFGMSPSVGVGEAWGQFEGLMVIYRGIAYGLGLALPMSMLSTLGTLSYVSLRHPGSEQLAVPSLEETSGIPLQGPKATTVPPPDATHPAETRPAPADYSGEDSKPETPAVPEPAAAAEPPPISDDSDEQPVVKD